MNRVMKAALVGALAAVLISPALAAPTIQVDFDLQYVFPGYTDFDGSFVASDVNGDGFISQNEVTDFRNNGLGEATLLSFGDFDIADNLWTTDNSASPGEYYVATAGLNTYYDGIRPETTVISIPEPGNALLIAAGIGMLAVFARRQRTASGLATPGMRS